MAQAPSMQLNFRIDARRLSAARDSLARVAFERWKIWSSALPGATDDIKSLEWDDLTDERRELFVTDADAYAVALLKEDFDLGMQGLEEEPPFYWEKRMPKELGENDKTVWTINFDDESGESHILLAFHTDDSEMSPQDRAISFTNRLNRVVRDWLFRRIPSDI